MNKKAKEYLSDIKRNKNTTVIKGCMASLEVSIKISKIEENKKQEMLDLLALMEHYFTGINSFIQECVNNTKKSN